MNPNINNICSFPTSIAEGHLYQSFYHQRMGLLRLGLVSECRVTKNTANDTYFPILFFYFSNIIVERFKTTLTSDDAKQKKWFMIPKVASSKFSTFNCSTEACKTIRYFDFSTLLFAIIQFGKRGWHHFVTHTAQEPRTMRREEGECLQSAPFVCDLLMITQCKL